MNRGFSIYKMLIHFPVSVGCQRLLLMQQCNGMWIMRHCGVEPVPTLWKWTRQHGTLPATSNSWESWSWLSITKAQMRMRPILTGFTLCQTRMKLHVQENKQINKQKGNESWKKENKRNVWSVTGMSWFFPSNCTKFDLISKPHVQHGNSTSPFALGNKPSGRNVI